ncbi:MAG: hypothetical protein A2Y38_02215 [Spirochaetes bacterium GWB1_59_5]|nr:MAG: hypothetical protein A2Y38_02215 [Spirochaetes bacterium GWB1_59_5]
MKVTRTRSADGRPLLKVLFLPDDPNPDKIPEIEVVYDVKQAGTTNLLCQASVTRKDTREAVFLTDEQQDAILEAATEHLANEDNGPSWG